MKNYCKANNVKFVVDGIPLYRWCADKGYPYTAAIQMVKRGLSIDQMKERLKDRYYSIQEMKQSIDQAAYYYAKEYPGASRDRRLEIRSEFTSMFSSHRTFDRHWERIVSGKATHYSSSDIELWKRVPGDEHLEVSNQGNFRKCDLHGHCMKIKTYVCLKKNKSGMRERKYLGIKSNGLNARRAARIVAMTWVPNPLNKPVVQQIDGDYANIHPSNLKWISLAFHGMTTGYSMKRSRPVELMNESGEVIETFQSVRDAAKELSLSYTTISDYCKNKVKKSQYQLRFSDNPMFMNTEILKKKYQLAEDPS